MAASARGQVVDVLRDIWSKYPAMRSTLEDPLARRELTMMLLGIYGAAGHSIDSCLAAVARAGYHIAEHPPARERPETDPARAVSPEPVPMPSSLATQAGRLLVAYWEVGEAGLTAEEAREAAGLSRTSCYWKRISELRINGLLEYMRDESDDIVRRPGATSALQQVSMISTHGRAVVAMLDEAS
jgi:hypothetical protein